MSDWFNWVFDRGSGMWRLPSGRSVRVGAPSDPSDEWCWVGVDLGDDVLAFIDLDDTDPGGVEVSLFWPPTEFYWPDSAVGSPPLAYDIDQTDGCKPWGYEATVAWIDGQLAVTRAPWGSHGECCPGEDETESQFRTRFPVSLVPSVLDMVTELPKFWEAVLPPHARALWRGRLDSAGRAIVEVLDWNMKPVDSDPLHLELGLGQTLT